MAGHGHGCQGSGEKCSVKSYSSVAQAEGVSICVTVGPYSNLGSGEILVWDGFALPLKD